MDALLDRIASKFDITESGCWEWTAGRMGSGYAAVMAKEIGAASNRATHCPLGHAYDAANTYLRPDGKGRDCRTCRRMADTRRHNKRRGGQ